MRFVNSTDAGQWPINKFGEWSLIDSCILEIIPDDAIDQETVGSARRSTEPGEPDLRFSFLHLHALVPKLRILIHSVERLMKTTK